MIDIRIFIKTYIFSDWNHDNLQGFQTYGIPKVAFRSGFRFKSLPYTQLWSFICYIHLCVFTISYCPLNHNRLTCQLNCILIYRKTKYNKFYCN